MGAADFPAGMFLSTGKGLMFSGCKAAWTASFAACSAAAAAPPASFELNPIFFFLSKSGRPRQTPAPMWVIRDSPIKGNRRRPPLCAVVGAEPRFSEELFQTVPECEEPRES